MEPEKLNLHQKILKVSSEVRTVSKDIKVSTSKNNGYQAVSDYRVTTAVKDAEKKFGINTIPFKQELVDHQVFVSKGENGYEKTTYAFIVKMTVRAINVDDPNDYFDVEAYGFGLDTGDKGFGKASTYARKYCLLNLYKIATGDDPDQWASPQVPELTEVTDKMPTMWASAIEHAKKGESREEVNDLIRERGCYVSIKGWKSIKESIKTTGNDNL